MNQLRALIICEKSLTEAPVTVFDWISNRRCEYARNWLLSFFHPPDLRKDTSCRRSKPQAYWKGNSGDCSSTYPSCHITQISQKRSSKGWSKDSWWGSVFRETTMPVRHNELHSGEILLYFLSFVAIMIPHRKDGGRELYHRGYINSSSISLILDISFPQFIVTRSHSCRSTRADGWHGD